MFKLLVIILFPFVTLSTMAGEAPPLDEAYVESMVNQALETPMEILLEETGSYACQSNFFPGGNLPFGVGNNLNEARVKTGLICIKRRCNVIQRELAVVAQQNVENPESIRPIRMLQGLSDKAIEREIAAYEIMKILKISPVVNQNCRNSLSTASGVFVMCFNMGMYCGKLH